jgi:hypothetical protein
MKNQIHPLFNVADYFFGGFDKPKDSYNELFSQVQNLKQRSSTPPRLDVAFGLEHDLYEMNTKFRDLAIANSILLTYEEGPGGQT